MRFAKYQRAQCLRSVRAALQDTKETRLMDDTFTLEEVITMMPSPKSISNFLV